MIDELEVMHAIIEAGGTPYYEGGYVRDRILGVESKDMDIEVHNMTPAVLSAVLEEFGDVDEIGKSFGVFMIHGEPDVQFSLPRRDNKVAPGHKGFEVIVDPGMTIEEAAERRDFTINTMAMDLWGKIYDPFDGERDLRHHVLAATSQHFSEDPLRVLRGMQFCGRFDLAANEYTEETCRRLNYAYKELPKERVWEEWKKWALKSTYPSEGLIFLQNCGWMNHFPQINAMHSVPQNPKYHPEGDVFEHTLEVVDNVNPYTPDRLAIMLAALCHDMGKPETTQVQNGVIVSPGHAGISVFKANEFLTSIGAPNDVINQVLPLVACHMRHLDTPSRKTVSRLARDVYPATIDMLCSLMYADNMEDSIAFESNYRDISQIWDIANNLACTKSPIPDILMGRHLIELGFKPGPLFSTILKNARWLQEDDIITNLEQAKSWVMGMYYDESME